MKKKSLLLAAVAIMVAATVIVAGTLAYFTSTDSATNTFTVGDVDITLAENNWVEDSKLIPNTKIAKDPVITVVAGSEESYIRAQVTFSSYNELVALLGTSPDLVASLTDYDSTTSAWSYTAGTPDDTKNTITYTFLLKAGAVDASASTTDVLLEALFNNITVPADWDDISSLIGFKITIVAQAIQTAGFSDTTDETDPLNPVTTSAEDNAWAAFIAPITP